MADYEAMETFVAVVRAGSFRGASEALRVPRSTVSQRVARLEAQLGVRLLERTTRSLRVTAVGGTYYERCARIVAEVDDANRAAADSHATPRGVLRVACSVLFGHAYLARIAAAFTLKYPEIAVELVATDRRVNPVEEGFDVAVGIVAPDDRSDLIARKLVGAESRCYASPAYVAARGAPVEPEDVRAHACIVHGEARTATWRFERRRDARPIRVTGRLAVTSLLMAHDAARAGAGLATLPAFLCGDDVRDGRLVAVLDDWVIDRADLRIVYPSARQLAPRVRLFVNAVVEGHRARSPKAP